MLDYMRFLDTAKVMCVSGAKTMPKHNYKHDKEKAEKT